MNSRKHFVGSIFQAAVGGEIFRGPGKLALIMSQVIDAGLHGLLDCGPSEFARTTACCRITTYVAGLVSMSASKSKLT